MEAITLPMSAIVRRQDNGHIKCLLCGASIWNNFGAQVPHKPGCAVVTAHRPLSRDRVRELALENKFTIKEGLEDLKDYVYEFAADLIAEAQTALFVGRKEKNTILYQGWDSRGRVVFHGARSSETPADDHARMQTAIEFYYAVKRGVNITPQILWDRVIGERQHDRPMAYVNRSALNQVVQAVRDVTHPQILRDMQAVHHAHIRGDDEPIALLMKQAGL